MSKDYQTHHLDWHGIRIAVRYCASWSPAYAQVYGEPLAHLAIEAVEPPRSTLPMTETGYRSHFTPAQVIDHEGGPVAFVRRWLDELGHSSEWREREAAGRQMSLL
jgi:hypothetical protein